MNRSKVFNILSSFFILASLFVGVYLVGVKTGFIKRAFGVPANLVVDVGTSFVNAPSCWRSLAQGGESKNRMMGGAISEIKKLQPEYIRIDHIFDNYDVVGRDGAGQLTFNWSSLDQTVDDILTSGAKPFLSLSYMPTVMSKDGKVESEPENWADWRLLVQRTIEHYSGKKGKNIENVYYEVWNEPDLFGGFKPGGDKSYFDLYSNAVVGANAASGVNSFKIGGPATTGLYKSWFDSLLKAASRGGIRLDFFSWHNYSKNLDDYDNDVKNASSWRDSYPNYKNLELIVSEMGINSENDVAYDGNLSAIQTLSSVSTLQPGVSKCFSFELIDGAGPQKLWGRWGLLTNEKYGQPTPKPRFLSIEFLNRMVGDGMGVTGAGSWVKAFARYDGAKIRVLVANFDPEGKHGEVVPIKFINMPFRKFTITRINFLGGTASRTISIDTNSWDDSEGFDPNTAAIFEITPQ